MAAPVLKRSGPIKLADGLTACFFYGTTGTNAGDTTTHQLPVSRKPLFCLALNWGDMSADSALNDTPPQFPIVSFTTAGVVTSISGAAATEFIAIAVFGPKGYAAA